MYLIKFPVTCGVVGYIKEIGIIRNNNGACKHVLTCCKGKSSGFAGICYTFNVSVIAKECVFGVKGYSSDGIAIFRKKK